MTSPTVRRNSIAISTRLVRSLVEECIEEEKVSACRMHNCAGAKLKAVGSTARSAMEGWQSISLVVSGIQQGFRGECWPSPVESLRHDSSNLRWCVHPRRRPLQQPAATKLLDPTICRREAYKDHREAPASLGPLESLIRDIDPFGPCDLQLHC